MMAIHVAILKPEFLRPILDGHKTVESRLTQTERAPYGVIRTGERLFLKSSGGPFFATAIAGRIDQYEDLTLDDMRKLYARYHHLVGGDKAYWRGKRGCKYGVFIALREVEPLDIGPVYPKINMRAWHVLDEEASPLLDVTLTRGAIGNSYVILPRGAAASATMSAKADTYRLSLTLPDGRVVKTDFARGAMLRWRGWGAYYRRHAMRPGDRVRFVALGRGRYRVSFVKRQL